MRAISEAELIEADFVVDCLEAPMLDFIGNSYELRGRWFTRGETGIAILRRLIEQERAGQLCAECGVVILPGSEPHGAKAV